MKKIAIILIYLLITLPILHSQQMDMVWQKCLGTDIKDSPGCIVSTTNGFLTSTTIRKSAPGISNYHGSGDAWLVELDTLGNIIWEKCFGGSDGEGINKIIELPNSEYYLLGGTSSSDGDVQSNNYNSYVIWVVKLDSSRNIVWERCYGTNIFDGSNDAIATPDGGLLILGNIATAGGDVSTHYGLTDAWLCRIDSLGNILWERSYGNQGHNELWSITPTSHNTYMLIGHFYESGGMIECDVDSSDTYQDVWIIEIDTSGNLIKQFCFGGSSNEVGYKMIEEENGYVFLALTKSNDIDVSGLHGETGTIYTDIWVVRIDTIGNIIWQKCLGGYLSESSRSIFKTQDGGYMVFGYTNSIDGDVVGHHNPYGTGADIWAVKLDQGGELQWQQCIGGHGRETITRHSILKLDDYNYAITSESNMLNGDVECEINPNVGDGTADAWIFQIKGCSQYQPSTPQKPTGKDYLCVNTDSVTIYTTTAANGAWYYEWQFTPKSAGELLQDSIRAQINWNSTYEGPATLKVRSSNDCGESAWSDSLSIDAYICLDTKELESVLPAISIYPNPATSTLTVKYNKKRDSKQVSIELISIYGGGLAEHILPVGEQNAYFDIKSISPGLYFIRVRENNKIVGVRKVIVK